MNRHQCQIARHLRPLPPWGPRLLLIKAVLYRLWYNIIYPLRNPSWPWALLCYVAAAPIAYGLITRAETPSQAAVQYFNLNAAALVILVGMYAIALRMRAFRYLPSNRLYTIVAAECYAVLSSGLASLAQPTIPWMAIPVIIGVTSVFMLTTAISASLLVAVGQQARLVPV